MRQFSVLLLLFLWACGNAHAAGRDIQSYPIFHDSLKFVEWIYEQPAPKTVIFEDSKIRPYYYTSRLVQLTSGRERCYKEKFNMDWLDFNYIVLGADHNIQSLHITKLWQEGDMAKILVQFRNSGEQQKLEYLLRHKGSGWMIDDIFVENGSLSRDVSQWCAQ